MKGEGEGEFRKHTDLECSLLLATRHTNFILRIRCAYIHKKLEKTQENEEKT